MGYTHYWYIKGDQDIPAEALNVLSDVLTQAYQDGVIAYDDGVNKPPVIDKRDIRFNGVHGKGYETFWFSLHDEPMSNTYHEGTIFACCKTAEKPYDEWVMKTLLILAYFLGDRLCIHSDGQFNVEWKEARAWCKEQLGIRSWVEERLLVA